MLNAPAVSVIVPLYNAEKYIADCLNSILTQSFQDFEVIVVDDCSTDTSPAIVESYLPKFDGRLKFYRMDKRSGSAPIPRNKGLILSRGEYVFFMDNDDVLLNTALQELYMLAKKFDADVVHCERRLKASENLTEVSEVRQSDYLVEQPTLDTDNLAERINIRHQGKLDGGVWTNLVRRELLIKNEIFFPDIVIAEDDVFTYGLLFFAKRILRVPNIAYVLREATSSSSRKPKNIPQHINYYINPIVFGIKTLDNFMNKVDFFAENPQYRYIVFENFINKMFVFLKIIPPQVPPFIIYDAIKQEFGDKLGEQDVLVSALCTCLYNQQKIFAANNQHFNQFTEQAQNRIKDLEAQLAESQRRIAELEASLK